jgi:hypothetical protein
MMKAENPFYVFLAFASTVGNFSIGSAVLFQNLTSDEIMDIFKNFAGLFIISTMDNMIAEFVALYMPEKDDDDFLEVPFTKRLSKMLV